MHQRQIILLTFMSSISFLGCTSKAESRKIDAENKSGDEIIKKSVDDFNNRPVHVVLTKQILDTLPDDKLEETVADNVSMKLGTDSENEKSYRIVKTLSPGRQAIFATYILDGEVNNGGFNQYFYNYSSSGQYAEVARDGFKLIGAPKYSQLTQRAIDTVMKYAKHLSKFNDGTWQSFSKSYDNNPLNDLDQEFVALEKIEDLSRLRIAYIKKHLEQFIDQ